MTGLEREAREEENREEERGGGKIGEERASLEPQA